MKTSNILIATTLFLFIGLMLSYNMLLRAEYNKGEFLKPLYGYTKLNFKDFEKIKVKAGNVLHVRIKQGNENTIYVKDRIKSKVTFRETEGAFTIIAGDEQINDWDGVIITCKRLNEVNTEAIPITVFDREKGKLPKQKRVGNAGVFLEGFTQDSLILKADEYTTLTLERSAIKNLFAVADGKEQASLRISESKIAKADIRVSDNNALVVEKSALPIVTKGLSDKAKITISGNLLQQIAP